jgi:hypothetical protein
LKNNSFVDIYFYRFSTHFTTVTSKTSTLNNEKNLTKGIQSLLTLILQGAKKPIFFTSTPKDLRVLFGKIASKQPLLKTSRIVQNWNQFWYFQL